jgi:protein-tyrosine phosphatase
MVTTTEFETQGAIWWRKPCHITDDILLSGDLNHHIPKAREQLVEWRNEGVTHILDCRSEWSDEPLVKEFDDTIEYLSLGTHDSGGDQEAKWYRDGWNFYERLTEEDSNNKVLVHCHMGVNRAPSMVFYLMIKEGYEPKEALNLIRTNRPIAACYYANSAWNTFADDEGLSQDEKSEGFYEIDNFFVENHINLRDVIHQIRQVEHKQ